MYGRAFFVALTLVAALAQALVYGLGGYYAITGQLSAGTVVTLALLLTRLYGPLTALSNARVDVMSALVSFDRVFEVLDLEPMIADAPDAVELPADARSDRVRRRALLLPDGRRGVAGLARGRRGARPAPSSAEVLHGVSFRAEPGQLVALVGPSGAGKTTISQLRAADLRRARAARCGSAGSTSATVTQHSLRDRIGVVSQEAHMFHDTIRDNLRYAAPDATDAQLLRGDRRRADRRAGRARCPTASTPSSAIAATGSPAARRRGWRSPGCCSRQPQIVILDEATAHLDSESEVAVQRALAQALAGPHVAGDRAPAVDDPQRRPGARARRRAASSSAARTPSCSPPAGSTPSCTAPSSSGRPSASSDVSRAAQRATAERIGEQLGEGDLGGAEQRRVLRRARRARARPARRAPLNTCVVERRLDLGACDVEHLGERAAEQDQLGIERVDQAAEHLARASAATVRTAAHGALVAGAGGGEHRAATRSSVCDVGPAGQGAAARGHRRRSRGSRACRSGTAARTGRRRCARSRRRARR